MNNLFNKTAEKMMLMLPDNLTGNRDVLRQKYRKKYGSRDCSQDIKLKKIRIMKAYMILLIVFLITALYFVAAHAIEQKEINMIERPTYGEKRKSVPVEVKIMYEGHEFTKNLNLKVKQKEATDKEKMEILKNYGELLENDILGNNKSLEEITGHLNLPSRDHVLGITIVWTSDTPEVVNDKGEVDLIKAKDDYNSNVKLQAVMTLDEISTIKTFQLMICKGASKEEYEKSIENKLLSAVKMMEADSAGSYLMLPSELEDNVRVRWFNGSKESTVLLLILFILGSLIIYFKRYDQINKEIREAEESIVRDLPEFTNKLVLLLNAGLVVSSAFKKIAEDYEANHRGEGSTQLSDKKRVLYDEICNIQKKVNQTNLSLIKELQEFSQRSGVREFVRMTAVISDNWNKGSVLAEKLEGESNLLWISRKKRAEEKGKLAETKLTLPLMILLIVLIMVTIAPALMEM